MNQLNNIFLLTCYWMYAIVSIVKYVCKALLLVYLKYQKFHRNQSPVNE